MSAYDQLLDQPDPLEGIEGLMSETLDILGDNKAQPPNPFSLSTRSTPADSPRGSVLGASPLNPKPVTSSPLSPPVGDLLQQGEEEVDLHSNSPEVDLLGSPTTSLKQTASYGGDPLAHHGASLGFEEQSLGEPTPAQRATVGQTPASPPPPYHQHALQQAVGSSRGGSIARGLDEDGEETGGGEFSPLVASSGGADLNVPAFSIRSATVEESPIKVQVRDPEKVDVVSKLGIRTSHITYLVHTDSTLPGLRADGVEVRRRFSEFDSLHKMLKTSFRGYIIPPLPEKSYIDSKLGQDDFVRLRRADLQAFVRGIVTHPVLREAEALKLFLLQPGELQFNPAWTMAAQAVTQAPAVGNNLLAALDSTPVGHAVADSMSGWVSWMRHTVQSHSTHKRELDDEEKHLRESKELLIDLERLLQLSCESARVMCSHMENVSTDMFELGRNFGMLSKFEEVVGVRSGQYTQAGSSAAQRGADCKKAAYVNAKQHTLWKSIAVKAAASLVSLHDYYILVPEAVAALDERETLLAQLHGFEDDLVNKQAQLNAGTHLKGPVGGRDKRQYQLTAAIQRLEEQIKSSRELYQVVKQRNQSELLRLNLEREADFRRMYKNFCSVQATLVQQSAAMWAAAAKQFDEGSAAEQQ